jgi:hypothetical protein
MMFCCNVCENKSVEVALQKMQAEKTTIFIL